VPAGQADEPGAGVAQSVQRRDGGRGHATQSRVRLISPPGHRPGPVAEEPSTFRLNSSRSWAGRQTPPAPRPPVADLPMASPRCRPVPHHEPQVAPARDRRRRSEPATGGELVEGQPVALPDAEADAVAPERRGSRTPAPDSAWEPS
jgi:hypothetical protein